MASRHRGGYGGYIRSSMGPELCDYLGYVIYDFQKSIQGFILLISMLSIARIICCPSACTSLNSLPLIRFNFRTGSAASFSTSVGCLSSSGRVRVYWYVDSSTAWVFVSAIEVAYDRGVCGVPPSLGRDERILLVSKCPSKSAENKSPTPEKYPGMSGTYWACIVDRPSTPSRSTVDEHRQRRKSPSVWFGGCMCAGRASINHRFKGMELMTTLGT